MAIRIEHVGDVAVVIAEEGVAVHALESELQQLVSRGECRIVVQIDFAIDEPLLSAICRVKHQVGSVGGVLCLAHYPTSELPKLRAIARSTCLPPLFNTREEALKALQEV